MDLWDTFDGEPFLDNPSLLLINRKKGKKTMAKRKRRTPPRNAKGRFVKTSRAKTTRRRRGMSRRTAAAVTRHIRRHGRRSGRRVVRLHRGQVALVNRHRRHYRRNPGMFSGIGLNTETLKTVGLTAGGFLGTPFVEGFVVNYLPTSLTSNRFARYAIRIAAAVGLGFLVGKAIGKEAGKKVAIGGLAYFGVGLIKDFMPTLGTGTGSYLRSQPLLGTYQKSSMGSYMTSSGPARNDPANRY